MKQRYQVEMIQEVRETVSITVFAENPGDARKVAEQQMDGLSSKDVRYWHFAEVERDELGWEPNGEPRPLAEIAEETAERR